MIETPWAPRAHILVVDDHEDSAESLVRLFRLCGFDIAAAANGEQAIESALHHWPDIVLLDLDLPAMDGYDVAIRLRRDAESREIILIAVTGYACSRP
jgi:CheY-like chemotaxis protein